MTDEMRYRGNALLRDSIVGKVELLHVAAVTDAVEEKRQSLVANVVVIERQFADAHLLQRCGSRTAIRLLSADPERFSPLPVIRNGHVNDKFNSSIAS